jgi:hypothetical protein
VGPDLSLSDRLVHVSLVNPGPSIEGLQHKENHMSRNATFVKFALLMVLLVALAMLMGSDPWGPI